MNDEQMQLARIEQLLEENLEIAEETNNMLRDLRRWNRAGFWFRVLVWAAVIVLPFLLLKPIIETLVPSLGGNTPGNGFFGLPSQADIERAIESYQAQ